MTTYIYSNRLLSSSTIINNIQLPNKKDKYNSLAYVIPINSFHIESELAKFNSVHKHKYDYHHTEVFLPNLHYFVIWYLAESNFPIDPVKLQQLLSVASFLLFRININKKNLKRNRKLPTLEMCIKSMLTTVLGYSLSQLTPSFITLIYKIPHITIDIKEESSLLFNKIPYLVMERNHQIFFQPNQLFETYDLCIDDKTLQPSQEEDKENKLQYNSHGILIPSQDQEEISNI
ncbi:hypothetical protein TCON_2148 [Astathelohania contejeani]|uniref:Uncharacterized protein n=1 Tax=Astathelohania contejeani TaxID=164912 RepID=A0ABQ7HWU1_9MICR|nr:hypothetical protein TCON_2148 [Thelohania contejeani]